MEEQTTATAALPPFSVDSFKNVIQIASTLVIGASTTFFVIGLLVVNLNLAAYGLHSLEIDRAEYVLVGAVAVFLCGSAYYAWQFFWSHLAIAITQLKAKGYKKAGRLLIESVGTLFIACTALAIMSKEHQDITDWELWASVALLGCMGDYARQIGVRFYKLWLQMRAHPMLSESFAGEVTELVQLIVFLLAFLGTYSHLTYPLISTAWGGGHRDAVKMLLTDHGGQVASESGIPMVSATATGSIYILSESDHEMVVSSSVSIWKRKPFVRIKRELVEATVSLNTGINAANQAAPAQRAQSIGAATKPPLTPEPPHPASAPTKSAVPEKH